MHPRVWGQTNCNKSRFIVAAVLGLKVIKLAQIITLRMDGRVSSLTKQSKLLYCSWLPQASASKKKSVWYRASCTGSICATYWVKPRVLSGATDCRRRLERTFCFATKLSRHTYSDRVCSFVVRHLWFLAKRTAEASLRRAYWWFIFIGEWVNAVGMCPWYHT